MRDWWVQHPTATFAEIEEELDKRMARMRAGLLRLTHFRGVLERGS